MTEMPGSVWKVLVEPGASVDAGDVLLILEVMKTEVPHFAPSAGVVREVLMREGEFVDGGVPVVVLELVG